MPLAANGMETPLGVANKMLVLQSSYFSMTVYLSIISYIFKIKISLWTVWAVPLYYAGGVYLTTVQPFQNLMSADQLPVFFFSAGHL